MNEKPKSCPFHQHEQLDNGAIVPTDCQREKCQVWDQEFIGCPFQAIAMIDKTLYSLLQFLERRQS